MSIKITRAYESHSFIGAGQYVTLISSDTHRGCGGITGVCVILMVPGISSRMGLQDDEMCVPYMRII